MRFNKKSQALPFSELSLWNMDLANHIKYCHRCTIKTFVHLLGVSAFKYITGINFSVEVHVDSVA